jgi:hypothetical protein
MMCLGSQKFTVSSAEFHVSLFRRLIPRVDYKLAKTPLSINVTIVFVYLHQFYDRSINGKRCKLSIGVNPRLIHWHY